MAARIVLFGATGYTGRLAAEAKRSIAKLAAMNPAIVFPGHRGPLTGPDLVAQLEAAAA